MAGQHIERLFVQMLNVQKLSFIFAFAYTCISFLPSLLSTCFALLCLTFILLFIPVCFAFTNFLLFFILELS